MGNGAQVEISMFGYESVIGVSTLMGTRHSLNRVFMQMQGRGFASAIEFARRDFARGGNFQDLPTAIRSNAADSQHAERGL